MNDQTEYIILTPIIINYVNTERDLLSLQWDIIIDIHYDNIESNWT